MSETPGQIIARQYDRLLLERNTAVAELAIATAELARERESKARWKAEAALWREWSEIVLLSEEDYTNVCDRLKAARALNDQHEPSQPQGARP